MLVQFVTVNRAQYNNQRFEACTEFHKHLGVASSALLYDAV
jgi:hypothetical protein